MTAAQVYSYFMEDRLPAAHSRLNTQPSLPAVPLHAMEDGPFEYMFSVQLAGGEHKPAYPVDVSIETGSGGNRPLSPGRSSRMTRLVTPQLRDQYGNTCQAGPFNRTRSWYHTMCDAAFVADSPVRVRGVFFEPLGPAGSQHHHADRPAGQHPGTPWALRFFINGRKADRAIALNGMFPGEAELQELIGSHTRDIFYESAAEQGSPPFNLATTAPDPYGPPTPPPPGYVFERRSKTWRINECGHVVLSSSQSGTALAASSAREQCKVKWIEAPRGFGGRRRLLAGLGSSSHVTGHAPSASAAAPGASASSTTTTEINSMLDVPTPPLFPLETSEHARLLRQPVTVEGRQPVGATLVVCATHAVEAWRVAAALQFRRVYEVRDVDDLALLPLSALLADTTVIMDWILLTDLYSDASKLHEEFAGVVPLPVNNVDDRRSTAKFTSRVVRWIRSDAGQRHPHVHVPLNLVQFRNVIVDGAEAFVDTPWGLQMPAALERATGFQTHIAAANYTIVVRHDDGWQAGSRLNPRVSRQLLLALMPPHTYQSVGPGGTVSNNTASAAGPPGPVNASIGLQHVEHMLPRERLARVVPIDVWPGERETQVAASYLQSSAAVRPNGGAARLTAAQEDRAHALRLGLAAPTEVPFESMWDNNGYLTPQQAADALAQQRQDAMGGLAPLAEAPPATHGWVSPSPVRADRRMSFYGVDVDDLEALAAAEGLAAVSPSSTQAGGLLPYPTANPTPSDPAAAPTVVPAPAPAPRVDPVVAALRRTALELGTDTPPTCLVCQWQPSCVITSCGHVYCAECATACQAATAGRSFFNTSPCPTCAFSLSNSNGWLRVARPAPDNALSQDGSSKTPSGKIITAALQVTIRELQTFLQAHHVAVVLVPTAYMAEHVAHVLRETFLGIDGVEVVTKLMSAVEASVQGRAVVLVTHLADVSTSEVEVDIAAGLGRVPLRQRVAPPTVRRTHPNWITAVLLPLPLTPAALDRGSAVSLLTLEPTAIPTEAVYHLVLSWCVDVQCAAAGVRGIVRGDPSLPADDDEGISSVMAAIGTVDDPTHTLFSIFCLRQGDEALPRGFRLLEHDVPTMPQTTL